MTLYILWKHEVLSLQVAQRNNYYAKRMVGDNCYSRAEAVMSHGTESLVSDTLGRVNVYTGSYIQGHIYNFGIFWIFGFLVKSL